MDQEKNEQVIEVKLGSGIREIDDLQTLLKNAWIRGSRLLQ